MDFVQGLSHIQVEPEPKRLRVNDGEGIVTNHTETTVPTDQSIAMVLDPNFQPNQHMPLLGAVDVEFDRWKSPSKNEKDFSTFQFKPPDDSLDSLRLAYEHLKRESDKKDALIQDLLKKLNEALETIRAQSDQIKVMTKANEAKLLAQASSMENLENMQATSPTITSESRMTGMTAQSPSIPPEYRLLNQPVELRIVQQPPSQAVYQRILRPFPTVSIYGVNPKQYASFFVEVSLLKKSSFDDANDLQYMTWFKNTATSVTPSSTISDKDKSLLGGQLVQRSEPGTSPNSLVVVFRKLKVLTTSAQQGAFFVLRFVLKRYVDNVFETVGGVAPIISNPVEVFSHTLYLKGRPSTDSTVTTPPTRGRHKKQQMADHGELPDPVHSLALAAASEELENSSSNVPVLGSFAFHTTDDSQPAIATAIAINSDHVAMATIPTESASVTYTQPNEETSHIQ